MPRADFVVETALSQSTRARQLEAMFDVPTSAHAKLEWHGDVPFEARPWQVGLIVGPSGCGKSTILRGLFGEPVALSWGGASVIDDFRDDLSMQDIAASCEAVGFNTIPAWLRPFAVLSNGERFRVELARRLLETDGLIAIDEFTSVVDRQVAKIGSHAVQKIARRTGKRVVCASCHYDIVDWLQPDWILEPASMSFTWRELRRRPALDVELRRVTFDTWRLFAPFHYLTADLHRAAACWALFVDDQPVSFGGVLHRPHAKRGNIKGLSRLVTLPDWQGLGLAMCLTDRLGALYRGAGFSFNTYPAHPSLIRSFDKSPNWRMEKKPATFGAPRLSTYGGKKSREQFAWKPWRPCAVFTYCGPPEVDAEFSAAVQAKSRTGSSTSGTAPAAA